MGTGNTCRTKRHECDYYEEGNNRQVYKTKAQDLDAGLPIRYLGKMLQHHLLLSFTKRRGRKQLLPWVNFIQVFAGDGRLIYHLTCRCLQCWDKTERIPLKEPVGFVLQVDVDGVMPERQKHVRFNQEHRLKEFHVKVLVMLWFKIKYAVKSLGTGPGAALPEI